VPESFSLFFSFETLSVETLYLDGGFPTCPSPPGNPIPKFPSQAGRNRTTWPNPSVETDARIKKAVSGQTAVGLKWNCTCLGKRRIMSKFDLSQKNNLICESKPIRVMESHRELGISYKM
jgi:hypothetical protein